MKYDFDEVIDRQGTNSLKWDVSKDELPMWVADMDFRTAPCVQKAVEKRAAHGVFGYNIIPDEWYEAYRFWWSKYHGFSIDRDWLIFTTGVIPAISTAIRKFTTPAEKVVIQTPVYNIFFNSIINNGRRVLESPLVYKDGKYTMDLDDLEKKFSDPLTTMMLLCNPHNPVGEIWSRDILEKVGELAYRHHVLVLSDEIHCDLTAPGLSYIPFASVSEKCKNNSITAIAPTKAFNIAGLNSAAVVVPDEGLRQRMNRALNTDEVAEPGCFAIEAAVAAFSEEGHDWLINLLEYIQGNKDLVEDFLREKLPKVRLISKDATYLLWLDMSFYMDDAEEFQEFLRQKAGLYLSSGNVYGDCGRSFMRMNVACPRSLVEEGLLRLEKGIGLWVKK